MPSDLIDAHAAVDWATDQVAILENKITNWTKNDSYSVRVAPDLASGKKAYFLTGNPVPAAINAESGAIINSIRSSLDLLANALASRNGHGTSRSISFPVSRNQTTFRSGGKEKIRKVSAADQATIESLSPWQ